MDRNEEEQLNREVTARVSLYQGFGCVGCLSIVLTIFGLLAFTVWRSDAMFVSDPEQVVATLQQIVTVDVPTGFRGLQAAEAPEQTIAVLGPESYEGKVLTLDVPLLISAWSWQGTAEPNARRDEVIAFWKGRTLQRVGEVKELRTVADSVELTVRGTVHLAADTELVTDSLTLRAVTVVLPAEKGKPTTALSFLGTKTAFDEKAMRAFLASIR